MAASARGQRRWSTACGWPLKSTDAQLTDRSVVLGLRAREALDGAADADDALALRDAHGALAADAHHERRGVVDLLAGARRGVERDKHVLLAGPERDGAGLD